MEKEGNVRFEFANDITGEKVSILDAIEERERTKVTKKYYCTGCTAEMIAVNRKKPHLAQHFKHDAKYVKKHNIKCTFTSETERHKQTKIILNRIKKIKVPTLYKYAPQGSGLPDNLLQKAKIIEAAYTKAELQFYETDDGKVKYYDKKTENKHYLIKPDVTFFNEKDEPILFVEIKATHEVDFEKINKIRTLGIDTIEITIPKSSIREIEHRLITNTRKTKWIYNNEEANIKYIPNSSQSGKTVSLLDKEQRRIFAGGWTFECRQSQVKNLISEIEYHLGTELYTNTERGFRDEISRVEENTEKYQRELDELRTGIQGGVHSEFGDRRGELETGREKLEAEKADLDSRYNTKKSKLKEKTRKFDRGFDKLRDEIQTGIDEEFEVKTERVGEEQAEFDRKFEELRAGIQTGIDEEFGEGNTILYSIYNSERIKIEGEQEEFDKKFEELRAGIREQVDSEFEERREKLETGKRYVETKGGEVEIGKRDIEERRGKVETGKRDIKEEERRVTNTRARFTGKQSTIKRIFEQGIREGDSSKLEVTPENKELFKALRICNDWESGERKYKRYQKTSKCLAKKDYKTWT